MVYTNRIGNVYSDNVIDPLLTFETVSTWTVSAGTGTCDTTTNQAFTGNSSLTITNTDVENDITVTNSAQNTVINRKLDDFKLMFFLFKKHPLIQLSGNVKIFKNAALLDTQTFTLGGTTTETDQDEGWYQFVSDKSYYLELNDVITFTFTLDGMTGTGLSTSTIYIDGIKLYATNRNQLAPTFYTLPISGIPKATYGFYNYQHDGGSQAISASTWTDIDNDGEGALTNVSAGYPDKTNILNVANGQIDFSNLSLYDSVKIRVDTDSIVTTTGNDIVRIRVLLSEGALDVPIPLFNQEFDVSGTQEDVFGEVEVFMLSQSVIDNPAKIQIWCNQAVTLNLNGFNFKVQKRML